MDKLTKALTYLRDKHSAEFANTYGEPGYTDPEKGIIFANWNSIPDGLQKWLEGLGFELEWSDEWVVINDKAYRTNPDSHHWESQLLLAADGEYLTPDDSPDDWIEEAKLSSPFQPMTCLPSWFPSEALAKAGYELMPEVEESGLYPGQDSSPQTILKSHLAKGADYVIFKKVENSQFFTRFETFVRYPNKDESNKP